jgi:hypothetical protein
MTDMLQKFSRSTRSLRSDTGGATLLELTIVLPVLVALSLGVNEFGRALHHNHIVNKSVRDAARYLSRVPAVCPGGTIDANDVALARNLALTGYPSGGGPLISYWTNPASIAVTVNCYDNSTGAFRGRSEIPIVRVTATVPYTDLGLLGVLGLSALTFTAAHEEVVIGE